jgi:hypothetical protein
MRNGVVLFSRSKNRLDFRNAIETFASGVKLLFNCLRRSVHLNHTPIFASFHISPQLEMNQTGLRILKAAAVYEKLTGNHGVVAGERRQCFSDNSSEFCSHIVNPCQLSLTALLGALRS